MSKNPSIRQLKNETASSTKIKISPHRNKVAPNGFLLMKFESILYFFLLAFRGYTFLFTKKNLPIFKEGFWDDQNFSAYFTPQNFISPPQPHFLTKKVLLSCSMSQKLLKVDVYQMTNMVDLNKNVCIFFLLDFGSEPKISTICVQFIFRYQIH